MVDPNKYKRESYLPKVDLRVVYDAKENRITFGAMYITLTNSKGGMAERVQVNITDAGGAWNALKGLMKATLHQMEQDTSWEMLP